MDFHYQYNYFNGDGENREIDVEREHRRRVMHQVNIRIQLRDIMDPFAISTTEFMAMYRLPQHMVMQLTQEIAPYMPVRTSDRQIPLEIKVLCALLFYASGSYQRVVGRAADLSVSQATVSNIIREITDVLNHPDVLTRYVHFPSTRREREDTIRRNAILGLPRVLGCIDGTYVKIVPPPLNEHRGAYYCRKGYPALNVLLVCDADLYIMAVNARFPGSCADPFIYQWSGIYDEMERAYRESRCWLLGDSAYPQQPWLHVPLPHAEPGTPEYDYTVLHCHCRNPIERCNGVLKGRWRCLLADRTLHYSPERAGLIVNSCVVLHNFCRVRNLPDPHPRANNEREDGEGLGEDDEGLGEDDEEVAANFRLRQQALIERQFLVDYAHEAARRRRLE